MHRPALITALLTVALASLGTLAPLRAMAEASDGEPFSRRAAAGTGADGTEFIGTLYVQRFAAEDDQLMAIGSLSGQMTRAVGDVAQPVRALRNVPARLRVSSSSATCEALSLRLDPVRLEPRGPLIQVDPIRLDATAEPGQLARNLRCSLAEQLAAGAPASDAASLLNALLKLLA